MQKIITIIVFLLIFSVISAEADKIVRITLKNGNVLEWSNVTDKGNKLCTYKKAVGLFCINKSDIAFISGGEAIKIEKEDVFNKDLIISPISNQEKTGSKKKKDEEKKIEDDKSVQEVSIIELFEKNISEWKAKITEQKIKAEESNKKAEESMTEFMDSLKKPIPF